MLSLSHDQMNMLWPYVTAVMDHLGVPQEHQTALTSRGLECHTMHEDLSGLRLFAFPFGPHHAPLSVFFDQGKCVNPISKGIDAGIRLTIPFSNSTKTGGEYAPVLSIIACLDGVDGTNNPRLLVRRCSGARFDLPYTSRDTVPKWFTEGIVLDHPDMLKVLTHLWRFELPKELQQPMLKKAS
ncbi:MAG: hypothetical protein WAX89_00695 [Alphaproteobacteria bacterium]